MTDGSIGFMGERIDRLAAEKIAKLGIVQVIEGRRVFEHLTVEQNLKAGAHMRKPADPSKKDWRSYITIFPAKQKRNETAGFISGGEQQMTVVGRASMTIPKLILLDEPSMGLAPS